MKFGVVTFPGSNCDQDMLDVLSRVFNQSVVSLWHKDTSLQNCDFIILPGGFSYGDYLRSGAIARFSPIMQSVIAHAEHGGYVMGICNGFQILTEARLLPGALLHNAHQQFACKNVHIRVETTHSALTQAANPGQVLQIPIAHGEGRYYADAATLAALKANDQILFRYCDESGQLHEHANPNGSMDAIAGICNASRNVFGMMPHPERAAESILGNTDGAILLEGIFKQLAIASL